MKNQNKMTVKDYLKLPYHFTTQEMNDESGHYFFITVDELQGCQSDGKTIEEAYKNIYEAMECWLEASIDDENIPLPKTDDNYSGKFSLRLPKSLHAKLSHNAKNEGISLNQYALYKLSM